MAPPVWSRLATTTFVDPVAGLGLARIFKGTTARRLLTGQFGAWISVGCRADVKAGTKSRGSTQVPISILMWSDRQQWQFYIVILSVLVIGQQLYRIGVVLNPGFHQDPQRRWRNRYSDDGH